MSVNITNGYSLPYNYFSSTAALRQAVMTKGDEYSDYELSILTEINMLREDPVGYSAIVESEATVGYPFVRDDPVPAHCSEMTLEQLRVYIADFKRERAELKESLQKMQREFLEEDASMKARWGAEDAERAKKKRGASGCRKARGFAKDEDYLLDRQRAAQVLQDDYTRRVNEAKTRLSHLERSCRWAVDGANIIIRCVQALREAEAVSVLECNRGLALAARDVGNECHITSSSLKQRFPSTPPRGQSFFSFSSNFNTDTDNETLHLQQLSTTETCGNCGEPTAHRSQSKTQTKLLSERRTSDAYETGSTNSNGVTSNKKDMTDVLSLVKFESKDQVMLSIYGNSTRPQLSGHEDSSENEMLKKAMQDACGRYGYYSGAVRGVQMCGVFAPRKILIQMLLGSRVLQATLLAPNATHETCGFSSFPSSKQAKNLLMWPNGRLLGCGCVRAQDGTVSVTVIIANSFEELNVIRQSHDFSLPQIHRVLNSTVVGFTKRQEVKQTVLDINSSLGVKVIEPLAHPIFFESKQRVVRLIVSADPSVAEITAAVTSASDLIPSVPLLDCGLLLVQRRLDNIAEVEILLDVFVAQRRWSFGSAFLVHLFERSTSTDSLGAFKNIGFIRVTALPRTGENAVAAVRQSFVSSPAGLKEAETTMFRAPKVLARQPCARPIEVKEEPHGWPVVTLEFQRRCATIIEPLTGTWLSFGDKQHVAIQIPDYNYLQASLDNLLELLEKEKKYFEYGAETRSHEVANGLIISTQEKLEKAEKELQEHGGPLEEELLHVQKAITKKRGKELAKLEKHEKEIRQRLSALKDDVKDLQHELSVAKEDLKQLRREYILRSVRQKKFLEEYERLREYADRTKPLSVKVVLFSESPALRAVVKTIELHPTNAANTIYEGDVRLVTGFKGRAVLLVNDQEAVQWEVRPGL